MRRALDGTDVPYGMSNVDGVEFTAQFGNRKAAGAARMVTGYCCTLLPYSTKNE
jgi:hypothetical protein